MPHPLRSVKSARVEQVDIERHIRGASEIGAEPRQETVFLIGRGCSETERRTLVRESRIRHSRTDKQVVIGRFYKRKIGVVENKMRIILSLEKYFIDRRRTECAEMSYCNRMCIGQGAVLKVV